MLCKFKTAQDVIEQLELEKFPGKAGWFKLVYHDVQEECSDCEKICDQANSTTVLHLFEKNTISRWCRINSTLIWSFLAGSPLEILIDCTERIEKINILGTDFFADEHPIIIIPKGCWAKISTIGEWSLASFLCTPGFEFDKLEIAEEGWSP